MALYADLHRVFPLVLRPNSRKTRCRLNRLVLSHRVPELLL
jgi:hypothetical protein